MRNSFLFIRAISLLTLFHTTFSLQAKSPESEITKLIDPSNTISVTPVIMSGISCSGKSTIISIIESFLQSNPYLMNNNKNQKKYLFFESALLPETSPIEMENGITILLYCPLTLIPYYILWHNRTCREQSHMKSFQLALDQFFSLFYSESRGESYQKRVIGTISKRDFYTIFSYNDASLFPGFTAQMREEYLTRTALLFKNHFAFKDQEEILIAPIRDYDLVVNVALFDSPLAIAEKIIAYLKSRELNTATNQ